MFKSPRDGLFLPTNALVGHLALAPAFENVELICDRLVGQVVLCAHTLRVNKQPPTGSIPQILTEGNYQKGGGCYVRVCARTDLMPVRTARDNPVDISSSRRHSER